MGSLQLKWFILKNKLHYWNQSPNKTFDENSKLLKIEKFGLKAVGFQFLQYPYFYSLLPEKQKPEEAHSQ